MILGCYTFFNLFWEPHYQGVTSKAYKLLQHSFLLIAKTALYLSLINSVSLHVATTQFYGNHTIYSLLNVSKYSLLNVSNQIHFK